MIKLLLSVLVGALVGAEREIRTGISLRTCPYEKNDLKISNSTMSKSEAGIDYVWRAYGKPTDHEAAMLALMTQEDVKEFCVV